MDIGTDWETSTLFSPSKARAQEAQAKDWAAVDAWLLKKYASKRIPSFEKHEETLKALLTLASLNENADEQCSHIDRIEKAALSAHLKRRLNHDPSQGLGLNKLHESEDVNALAEAAVCLDCAGVDMREMAAAVVDLSAQSFLLSQQVNRAEAQIGILKSEQNRTMQSLEDLKQDALKPPADLLERTSEWLRGSKQMKAKVAEYDERLSGLQPAQSSRKLVQEISQQRDETALQLAQLSELSTELSAFRNLPPDPKAALAQLEGATTELLRLTKQRDRFFERMGDGG